MYVRTFSLLGEEGEGVVFSRPLGPYHSVQSEKPVNESSERMGQSSLPRSLGSRDCARDCGRELASESFLRSHLSSARKLQFLGVEVPDAINLPCALSKVEGRFPLGPSLGGSGLARCILLCV